MALFAQLYEARWQLLAIVFLVYAANKYRIYRRLSAFKGPFSTGWFDIWHTWAILGMRSHLVYNDVCERYGE
jgi:hypothetical protein